MIMMKTLRYFFVAALAMISLTSNASKITFADLKLVNGTQYTDPFDGDDFTVTFGGGANDGKYYTTGAAIRVYGGGYMTVAAKSGNITAITVSYDGSNKPSSSEVVNSGTYNEETGVWTGNVASVTFTRPSGTGHWRIKSVEVTVGGTVDTRTATSIEFSGDYLTKFTSGKDGVSTNLPTATVKAGDAAVAGAAITWTITKGTGWNEEVAIPTISGNTITGIGNGAYGDLIVKASYEGDATYQPSSKTYTLKMYKGRMNIKEILEDFDKLGDKNWNNGVQTSYWQVDEISEYNVVSKDALVTYVKNSYTYIKDNDGSLLLYGSNLGYNQGDIITGDLGNGQIGAIYGDIKTNYGLLELVTKKDECEFIVKSSDNAVEPTTITADQLDKSKMNEYLKIENAVYTTAFDNKNATFKVGEKEFTVRNAFGLSDDELNALAVGETYTLVGMGAMYNTTPQLYLISATSTSGINELKAANAKFDGKMYNVAGQVVNKGYKGLVIMNGRKFVNK